MDQTFLFVLKVFMGFFAIMNPFGNTSIFMGLTGEMSSPEKKRVAVKSTVLAFIIVFFFTLLGTFIFKAFGISLPAFQIAGGILLFAVGIQLIHGNKSSMHHPKGEELADGSSQSDISISPLAIPILAGPGTIAAAMNFAGENQSIMNSILVVAVFAVICLITCVFFMISEKLTRVIKPSAMAVIVRLMGLILSVIAVQMAATGIKSFF